MKFVILGLLVVLVIGFFVLVWKASRSWRWYQIVPVCLTMLLAIAFLFPTAGVLKSRAAWHQVKEDLERRAAEVAVEQQVVKYGDPTNPSVPEGVVPLSQQLSKLGIEAGRRWRNLQLQNAADQQITLVKPQSGADVSGDIPGEAPPVATDEPDGEAGPTPLVPEELVVYAFAETPNPQLQTRIPTFYLGEFQVTSSTPTQVTLAPTAPLEPAQKQAIGAGRASSWSLYEMLPLDTREAFIAEGSVRSDENYLGRVDEELVRSLLGDSVSPETLQSYLRDGSRATPDDPPLSRWTKIEFLQDHTIEVDSPEQRGALEGGYFDASGRAVDSRLQRGDEGRVQFSKGDQILIKEDAADELRDEGVAKIIDNYYLRPLNDYRFVLRHIRLRLAELDDRREELDYARTVLQEAIERSNAMLVSKQDDKLKLEQDLAQFRTETEAIAEHVGSMKQKLVQTRDEITQLHRQNIDLEQRLDDIHHTIQNQVDARTASVQ